MLVIKIVGHRDHLVIEPVVPCFCAADQKDCCASGIKGIENAKRVAVALDTEFTHVVVPACLNPTGIGMWQVRPACLKPFDIGGHIFLFGFGQHRPPFCKLVRVFNVTIHAGTYSFQGIIQGGSSKGRQSNLSLRQEPDGCVFVAPEVERGGVADGGGTFEIADQFIVFDGRSDDEALKDMPRAVVDIDKAAQVGGAGGINGKPVMPKAKDGENLAAEFDAQAGFAFQFADAGSLQPVAQFFRQKFEHIGPP